MTTDVRAGRRVSRTDGGLTRNRLTLFCLISYLAVDTVLLALAGLLSGVVWGYGQLQPIWPSLSWRYWILIDFYSIKTDNLS